MTITHCHPTGTEPGVGQIMPCGIGPWNTNISLPSTGPYRGIVVGLGGLATGIDGQFVTAGLTRVDSSATYSIGNHTILDPNCVATDLSGRGGGGAASVGQLATPPGLGIPVTAIVQSVNPGVSFTVQNNSLGLPTANGTGVVMNANDQNIFGQNGGAALTQLLLNDGWIVISPPYPEYDYVTHAALGVQNDLNNDTGYGARYLATTMLWWDHVLEFIQRTWGNWPIIPFGASWGGFHTLTLASLRTSSISAFMAMIPATVLSNAAILFTNPANYGPATRTLNGASLPGVPTGTTGLDLGPNALTSLGNGQQGTIPPGIVGYGTGDSAIAWSSTTNASGNIVDVNTFNGSGILRVTDQTQIVAGPLIQVATASGTAWITNAGTAAGELTGCQIISGSGVPTLGGGVIQSNTNAIITNAISNGKPVTRYSNSQNHAFLMANALAFFSWLSSLETSGNFPKVY